jgi:hypothetical protein
MNKDKIKELWQMPIYEGSENEADGWEFCEVRHPKKMTCEEFGVTEYHRRKLIVTGESISIPDEPVVSELVEQVDKAIKALSEKARWGEPYLLELLAVIALVRADDARQLRELPKDIISEADGCGYEQCSYCYPELVLDENGKVIKIEDVEKLADKWEGK